MLAPGLAEMARSEDGLVEAVYLPDKTFVRAVQWHPEDMYKTAPVFASLYKAFVAAAAEYQGKK